ncbi:Probable NAD(P)H dehydrogenase (quinone) FQR1-like 1 [Striga hermonthica]|uniref:Probable NAD(P)H dehydrogenase (Quinone) FQR1-like 1 n=1 Tax=Striga hermonthica TaxID=68872 RepID=A0A9N7NZT0_STRHE|nr:Probable NAD(P)H dehydrogenase (quinone) FQR1-like 1 [Striga hermonthica]
MSAPPKSDVPIITPNELVEADAFVFWVPDKVWNDGSPIQSLSGCDWRPVENLAACREAGWHLLQHRLTAITQLVHHGMIFVPIGYTFGAGMFEKEKEKGGSPYGVGTFAWDGPRQPSEHENEQAFYQGEYIATIANKLKGAA